MGVKSILGFIIAAVKTATFAMVVFCAMLALPAHGDQGPSDRARLPYQLVYQIQKAQEQLNRTYTNLAIVLTMESTLDSVKTEDITAYIDAKAGKIPVTIHNGGDFTIPMRDDLLSEDPWIVTSQPKGTMKLDWRVGIIAGRMDHTFSYARLMGPVHECDDVQEQMRRFLPGSPKLIMEGLRLTFPNRNSQVTMTIHAKGGERVLHANDRGEIIVPLVLDLLQENPSVTCDATAEAIEIVSHKQ